MSSAQVVKPSSEEANTTDSFKEVVTWRATSETRLEQVRVQVEGQRIKAAGQIVASTSPTHPAFSASYELVTNDSGVTRRLAVRLVRESGETHVSVTRDTEGVWLIQTPQGVERGEFDGAHDIDLALSPLFNALPIRRLSLDQAGGAIEVPVVYLYLPEVTVAGASTTYRRLSGTEVEVTSPSGTAALSVDSAGFVVNYPGLAERV